MGGVLPLSLFCGGHNYFVGQFAQRNGWQPYSIHTTFQYGGAPGKRHRLREVGHGRTDGWLGGRMDGRVIPSGTPLSLSL